MGLMTSKLVRWLFLVILVGSTAFAYFAWQKSHYPKETNRSSLSIQGSYFVPVDIISFTEEKAPCIEMQIANELICTKLDSGFGGDVVLPDALFQSIEDKKFLRTSYHYGIRGKKYYNDVYLFPNIALGNMTLSSVGIEAMNREFEEDAAFYEDGTRREPDYQFARIGWPVFYKVNLFLDCANAKIAFCDSLETLKKQGYPVEEFVETTLLLDKGSLEFEVLTEKGALRCLLDTGSTYCCKNIKLPEGEEAIMNFDNTQEVTTFKIGNKDYGPITFIELQTACDFDAIIGMDFLQSKLVFIDFPKEKIYFY